MNAPAPNSSSPLRRVSVDFELPVSDWHPPNFPEQTLEQIYACNDAAVRETVYDEAYFADSLARKVTVPFVMH